MKNTLQRILIISSLSILAHHVTATVVPYLAFRSQGFNAARELVGWQTTINKSCASGFYGSFSATPEYTRSFKGERIARYLFSDALTCEENTCHNHTSCSKIVKIQGTKVTNRDPKALMAENFYLPTDFNSEVRINPRIENFLVDLNLYLGLDNFLEGLYFRIHSPICYTRWNLNFCEHVINAGQNNYDVGYFDNHFNPNDIQDPQAAGIARSNLLSNFTQYACAGESIEHVQDITYQGLANARMNTKAMTKTRPAELTAALGWNFWTGDGYHCGVNIRGAAPTGNRPEGRWLFEPIVGNGHHWELGAGLTGHWRWWTNQDTTHEFSTYIDVNATTLFSSRQCRTFDLCGKPLSRYMLALKYTHTVQNLFANDGGVNRIPLAQFGNEFVPVANLTTIPVDVSVPLHVDAVIKFSYIHCNWQFDLGYDFWWRSCETICNRFDCCSAGGFADSTYGLKGDAFVYGFAGENRGGIITAFQPGIPLSASEHNATIYAGTNNYAANPNTWSTNSSIDLPHNAFSNNFPAGQNLQLYTKALGASALPVNTSYTQPIYIAGCDFDTDGAKTSGLSNKLFAHVNYLWDTCRSVNPYLGIGGEVEFGIQDKAFSRRSCDCHNGSECRCCTTASLSQWGVWLKAGCAFE